MNYHGSLGQFLFQSNLQDRYGGSRSSRMTTRTALFSNKWVRSQSSFISKPTSKKMKSLVMSIHPFLFSSVRTSWVLPIWGQTNYLFEEGYSTSFNVRKQKLQEVLLSVETLDGKSVTLARPGDARNVDIVIIADIHPGGLTCLNIDNSNLIRFIFEREKAE